MCTKYCFGLVLLFTVPAFAQVPIVGAEGVSIEDIVGTETIVTLVVGERNVEDPNERITAVRDGYMTVVSTEGEQNHYVLSDVKEIRVQGGVVTAKPFKVNEKSVLSSDQQQVLARSIAKVNDLFTASDDNVPLKMAAATLLLVAHGTGEGEKGAEAAKKFLQGYVESNDLASGLRAAYYLYLAGDRAAGRALLKHGLDSTNRKTKSLAARIAGFVEKPTEEEIRRLNEMLQDRAADVSVPALYALARLHRPEVIPAALNMIGEPESKSEAAVYALTHLNEKDGKDVVEPLKTQLKTSQGEVRFRILQVLFALGDPMGAQLLHDETLDVPSLAVKAALLLAPKGDLKATQILRERLSQRFDPLDHILINRADIACALIRGGDRTQIGVLQELLRSKNEAVAVHVCRILMDIGMRQLMTITQPSAESTNRQVALNACQAAIALAYSEFRARLVDALAGSS